jgi:ATP-dependent DNA helicase RecG
VDFVLKYVDLRVDELLVIHYLTRHREINARQTATICQRSLDQAGETLVALAGRGLLKSGGTGKARYYFLSRLSYARLGTTLDYYVDRRLDRENIKARLLDTLRDRPLSNSEIRQITQMGRQQVTRLMADLRREGRVRLAGLTKGARWHLTENQ